ncbi:hypothetical protein C6N75_07670 [Streptomyces solincola]|uniref:Uncharacterized protein n=1 Tax=Streptomyces solincola TaxID=2100817 RepID=A0A2S9PZA2_9ACTN|nr:hypothetical protein [Streptomyces solincola]PRH79744.1 hypothetical protein C6N75_07670 [Streptomyces solincola]
MSTPPPPYPPGPHQPGVPAPHNPYTQPLGQVPGRPGPDGGHPPIPPGAPGAPPPGGRRAPGWLWGAGGAVVASAVWAAALFGFGVLGGPRPEFGGHRFASDLCGTLPFDGFEERYDFQDLEDDDGFDSRQKGIDQSSCSRGINDRDAEDKEFADGYVSAYANWHKGSDPAGEFASLQAASEDRSDGDRTYETEPVRGLGDEAYVTTSTQKDTATGDKELDSMSLAVRDGWFTLELSWSWYGSDDDGEVPSRGELRELLEQETRTALAALRER